MLLTSGIGATAFGLASLVLLQLVSLTFAATDRPIDKIIFEDQKIEGKIRRPQLVLIKAETRPQFVPMVMESFGKHADITRTVSPVLIESSPYSGAFQFSGKEITNYAP